jgi:hypothetical protein
MSHRSPRVASSARTRNCGLPGQLIQRAGSTTPLPPPWNRSMRNPLWTWWAAKVAPELSSEAGNATGPQPKVTVSSARSGRRTRNINSQRAVLPVSGQAPSAQVELDRMPESLGEIERAPLWRRNSYPRPSGHSREEITRQVAAKHEHGDGGVKGGEK